MDKSKIRFTDNFFNIKLYLQALKRLRVTGIVTLICLSLLSVIAVFGEHLDRKTYIFIEAYSSIYSLMLLILFVMVPVMALIIFHYLTTRNGSDFYHSIASKRRSVYFSFVAAILTWSLIVIACFTLVTSFAYILVSDYCILNANNIIIYAFNIFISCILVTAVFALGCSMTGTLFSNLVASVCILVLPRLIITVFAYIIASNSPILSTNGMALLTRYTCNMPVSILFGTSLPYLIGGFFGYQTADTISTIDFSTLYTFVLSVIYIIAGCIMYNKRPSETAGKAAASNKIQYCLRMLIGYLITLLIVIFLYPYIVEGDFFILGDFLFAGIIIFFIASLIMFLYELISTKSLKSACKALLHSPILLALDAVTIAILVFANYYTLNNVPSSSDVDYIKVNIDYMGEITEYINPYDSSYNLVNDENNSFKHYFYEENSYYYDGAGLDYIFSKLSDIEITNRDIIELATTALSNYTEYIKEDSDSPYYEYGEDGTSVTYFPCELCITYGTGSSEITRYIYLRTADAQSIINTLLSSSKACDILASLPEYDDPDTSVLSPSITGDELKDVYTTFTEELGNVSMKDYLTTLTNSHAVCTLDLYEYDNGMLSSTSFYLTSATPKAFALYMQYYNEHNSENLKTALSTVMNDSDSYCLDISACFYDYAEGIAHYATNFAYATDDHDMLVSLDTITNILAVPIPEDFENKFNLDTHYLCYISIDLYELLYEYSPIYEENVVAGREYKSTGGYYFILNKDYDIYSFQKDFSDGPYIENIYIP